MAKTKGKKVLAWPPREFQCIDEIDDLEKLSEAYGKLQAIAGYFSTLKHIDTERPVCAGDLYGYWLILRDIADAIAGVLKIDHWTGEVGAKVKEGENQ